MNHAANVGEQLADAADRPGPDLAAPAFLIARLEFPRLDPGPISIDSTRWVKRRFSASPPIPGTTRRLRRGSMRSTAICSTSWDSPAIANSTRTRATAASTKCSIVEPAYPITLALIYIEVARRAGLRAEGVNFPGHFLVRALHDLHTDDPGDGLIVDPFHAGAILNEHDCRRLLSRHAGDDAAWEPSLLARATRRQILVRMLLNLKRLYVRWRSFPQARAVADLLLALSPSAVTELRDRGLLAYHMNDFPAALRDLERYLKVARLGDVDEDQRKDHEQVWEHVKALRRRVASLN